MSTVKELVDFIARNLVDKPEEVEVVEEQSEDGLLLKLKVNPEELGKVIGRQGRIAKAIRTVLSAASSRNKQYASLEILD